MATSNFRGVLLPSLRAVREAKSISRKDLAASTGFDYSYLWRLEKGENAAGHEAALRIAEKLDVTVEQLQVVPNA